MELPEELDCTGKALHGHIPFVLLFIPHEVEHATVLRVDGAPPEFPNQCSADRSPMESEKTHSRAVLKARRICSLFSSDLLQNMP